MRDYVELKPEDIRVVNDLVEHTISKLCKNMGDAFNLLDDEDQKIGYMITMLVKSVHLFADLLTKTNNPDAIRATEIKLLIYYLESLGVKIERRNIK